MSGYYEMFFDRWFYLDDTVEDEIYLFNQKKYEEAYHTPYWGWTVYEVNLLMPLSNIFQ